MISTRTINVLVSPVLVKTLVTDGRRGGAAACAGGTTMIQTVIAVIRWISKQKKSAELPADLI